MVTEALAVTGAEAGHCCSVNAIARCTGYVVSGGGDAAIRVWKARTLTPVKCADCYTQAFASTLCQRQAIVCSLTTSFRSGSAVYR